MEGSINDRRFIHYGVKHGHRPKLWASGGFSEQDWDEVCAPVRTSGNTAWQTTCEKNLCNGYVTPYIITTCDSVLTFMPQVQMRKSSGITRACQHLLEFQQLRGSYIFFFSTYLLRVQISQDESFSQNKSFTLQVVYLMILAVVSRMCTQSRVVKKKKEENLTVQVKMIEL